MTGQELVNTVVARRGSTRFGVTGSWNNGNPTNDWGQCTAVPHDGELVLFGRVLTLGHAYQMIYNAPDDQYHKLFGDVEILPGDMVFQRQDPVLQTDWPGHTFMASGRSLPGQWIPGYSQNYPTGYPPHYRSFPRNGLIGVLRAKVLQSAGMATISDARLQQLLSLATFAGDQTYFALQMHVPEPGANSGRIGGSWNDLYNAIVSGSREAHDALQEMLVDMYDYGLGRKFLGRPINLALEIEPRINSLIARQATLRDHWRNIKNSPEGVAWQKTLAAALAGSDVVALQKLQTAKELAALARQPIDKISNL